MEQTTLQENGNLMTFKGVIGRKRYFINLALLMVGFTLTFIVAFAAYYADIQLPLAQRPSEQSKWMYIAAISSAMPLLYMSWINKFKRIRDIRGTQKNEKMWFGFWILLGLVPYSGIFFSIVLGMPKGKITNPEIK